MVIKALQYDEVPPIPNLKEPDPKLGDLNLSQGGSRGRDIALRFAAGFGSQLGMCLMKKIADGDDRIADQTVFQRWMQQVSGKERPQLEVVKRTLRISNTEAVETVAESAPAPAWRRSHRARGSFARASS